LSAKEQDEQAGASSELRESSSSLRLLRKARAGDRKALDQLFERLVGPLRRWARGRLPRWARDAADTGDLVQDALIHTLGRLDEFEPRRKKALQAYLRQAVRNRIRDEIRRIGRRPLAGAQEEREPADERSPLDAVMEKEDLARYRDSLGRLPPEDAELIVARVELGYSYEQIALMSGRRTADAARMAIRRSLLRLAEEMNAR
jgi:RNA polymerase sigma-70 factor, ECF subfamily